MSVIGLTEDEQNQFFGSFFLNQNVFGARRAGDSLNSGR